MRFLVSINAAPESATAQTSLEFTERLLQANHTITLLFFYADGVRNADSGSAISARWAALISQYSLTALCCSNSAAEHALTSAGSLTAGFEIGGIAQLTTTAAVDAERCVTFGTRTGHAPP
ncbi:DsrE/DsrF/TusD sulfur relay family protein [Teredinibacter turnerae]|uniref:DsrE/DsrF/TusD sulfur relay family protein n=1 Tax=Teredinibacter turnerae TaxID=2426 RepID=UPI00059F2832|nr:DsrE family protein [Teredinibacter turnerae]